MIFPKKISAIIFVKYVVTFSLFISNNTFSQSPSVNHENKKEEWHLRKNDNGIRVYSRRPPGSDVDEFKVISVIHASLSSIVAVVMDANHFPDWVYGCEESKILKQINNTEQYQYQVIGVPSPFSDRDAVIHLTLWQDPKTEIVYTRSVAAPNYIPANAGLVRLQIFDASYQLIPQSNGDVQVIYSLRTDPGGSIPDWLVNLTIVTGPYQSILKMHQQVQKPQYASLKLNFIKEP